MELRWLCCLVTLALGRGRPAAAAPELAAGEYYSMPPLFELDGWEACLAGGAGGVYCLGSFDLLPGTNLQLLHTIQEFSANKYHFNHSRLHRGYCVTSRCPPRSAPHTPLRDTFNHCVADITRRQYGLESNLTRLEYCRGAGGGARGVDATHLAFTGVTLAVLLANLAGTLYHLTRNTDHKPNKVLMAWSVCGSWARLTAQHEAGDPRLAALQPIQGIKALTLILVMLAHSVLAYHLTYIQNPVFLERASHHPLVAYFQNGSCIVHTFVLASSFLLAYNLLLHATPPPAGPTSPADTTPPTPPLLSLRLLPKVLLHRLVRILPLYMWIVGLAATWWVHSSDGPLWPPLIGGECDRCRDKWWTQLLFVNNLVRPDVKCLIHTWFLAVDMQLYVVCAALTLWLGVRSQLALRLLPVLLLLAVLANAAVAYCFDLRPMVTLMFPEHMRTGFEGERSFKWLYQAPWDAAPAALLGLLAAYIHHHLITNQIDLNKSRAFLVVYRLSVPCMFLWVWAGYYLKGVSAGSTLVAHAALDRPVFVALTAAAMIGFLHRVDSVWWRFLSWRGWVVLGRLSLPVYLVHWLYALTQLALRHHASPASVHEIGGHFLWTVFASYWTALPLHLLIEVPMQKFLQALF